MASIEELEQLDRKVRDLLSEQGLPAPSGVEYGFQCVRFFWHDSNVALVVDLEDDGDGEGSDGPHLRAAVGPDAVPRSRRPAA
jgi:hypothetical protein